MAGREAYYSLVQFCPDRSRLETANIGVLLHCPELAFTKVKTSVHPRGLARFFRIASSKLASLDSARRAFEHRINSGTSAFDNLDELKNFISTRANDLILTEPRLVKVGDPSSDLVRLFNELVEKAVASSVGIERQSRAVPLELREVFATLVKSGRARKPSPITVPVIGKRLSIPYAYQNGVYNLVKPQHFSDGQQGEDKALRLAVEGDLLHKHPEGGPDRRLIVVSSGDSEDKLPAIERRITPLFEEYGVRFVPRNEVPAFAVEVERDAHHPK